MSIWYARDVKSAIQTVMQSSSAGINYYISVINTERTESTPTAISVGSYIMDGQYPRVFLDLGNSTIEEIHGARPDTIREKISCDVSVLVKDNSENVIKYAENYIEAIIRCLQGYEDVTGTGKNFLMLATETFREDIDIDRSETVRGCGVRFNVYRNYLI